MHRDTIEKTVEPVVSELVNRARAAQAEFERGFTSQARVNDAVAAVAWAGYEQSRAEELARLACEESGMGRYEDKIAKNRRKTLGTLRDLLATSAVSVGVIDSDPVTKIVRIAKPVGVVAALTPSTNPAATPINKTMMAVKARDAIILAPSPRAARTCRRVVEFVRVELQKVGAPLDLIQCLPDPITKEMSRVLMRDADLVVATGSQGNVRAAYSSGTPTIGVGVGNVPVIIDDSADIDAAAERISRSKTFDFATSCSSENSAIILDSVYERTVPALERCGGLMLDEADAERLRAALWLSGNLNPRLIAHAPNVIAEAAGLRNPRANTAEFFMVAEDGVGPEHPFSGEKLSVVLAVYRASDLDAAIERARAILEYQGRGHSVGIHTADMDHAERLAQELSVVRVLVNQAHVFGNGGAFDNGLNFTLSMGCGTWGRNSISANLSYEHFLNITHLVPTVVQRIPTESALFGRFWELYGH